MSGAEQLRTRLLAEGDELAPYVDRVLERASLSVRLRPAAPSSAAGPIGAHANGISLAARVAGLEEGAVAIASQYHALVLLEDGTVRAWGENRTGKLGDGTRADRRGPVAVVDCGDVVAISAGSEHSAALTRDGTVLVWGSNRVGQLGDGTFDDHLRPRALDVPRGGVVRAVAGENTTMVIYEDGSVLGCGLWREESPTDGWDRARPTPLVVEGLGAVRDLRATAGERYAIVDDGLLVAWSIHEGRADVVATGRRVAAVAADGSHGLAACDDGSVVSLEAVFSLEGHQPIRAQRIPEVGSVVGVAIGPSSNYCLLADGTVVSWGFNFGGSLGDGTSAPRREPLALAGVSDAVAVAPQLALVATGAVMAWGRALPRQPPLAGGDQPVGGSRLGGRPDLPPGTAWPHSSDGRPLAFVAQLDLQDVAVEGYPSLPPAGTLSFFYDDVADQSAVVHTPAGSALAPLEPPVDLTDAVRFRPLPVGVEIDWTLPPCDSPFTEDLRLAEDEDAYLAYQAVGADVVGPVHRLFGHPDAIQGDPRTSGDEVLLLQVDSDDTLGTLWGDAGRIYFLIGPDDLATGRFDRARAEMQGH